ncbi:uncharacterized protein LOC124205997 [Daphnia pulex]|uniref:uncharacterized protein LOC124205997 n=1 Tax=Daphnia pulex TaxID=6669 RepID=UPI001EE09DFD|nr:uncharacterized protein LOC124205997 [Daphnia pulex]
MTHSSLSFRTCLVILACVIVVASLKSPKNSTSSGRWSIKKTNCNLKKSLSSFKSSVKNDSLTFFNRALKKTNPISALRKRLGTASKLYNPSDPLHAYPNQWDLIVHGIFQKLSRFEVNNADTIRTLIRVVRVVTIIGLVLGIIGIVIGVAVPLGTAALAIGRREDVGEDKTDVVDWNYVDQISQSVIYAIENGMLKYEM